MLNSFNTARALLEADNFEGARKEINKFLDNNPDDFSAWFFRIEIEKKSKNFKDGLELCRTLLAKYPDNFRLRETEFHLLINLGKKRDAKKVLANIKADFPSHGHDLETLGVILDNAHGRFDKVRGLMETFTDEGMSDYQKRSVGIAHHKLHDLYRAQRLMKEAHSSFPNDFELNATLATNSFQILRPATARKYARLALLDKPIDRRMRFLITASYLLYFPPFFMLGIFCLFFLHITSVIGASLWGQLLSLPFCLLLLFTFSNLNSLWYEIITVLLHYDVDTYRSIFTIGFIVIYFLLTMPGLFDKFFKSSKNLKLKKY